MQRGGVHTIFLDVHKEGGLLQIVQTWTRGGRGSKIPKILRTYFMDGPCRSLPTATYVGEPLRRVSNPISHFLHQNWIDLHSLDHSWKPDFPILLSSLCLSLCNMYFSVIKDALSEGSKSSIGIVRTTDWLKELSRTCFMFPACHSYTYNLAVHKLSRVPRETLTFYLSAV